MHCFNLYHGFCVCVVVRWWEQCSPTFPSVTWTPGLCIRTEQPPRFSSAAHLIFHCTTLHRSCISPSNTYRKCYLWPWKVSKCAHQATEEFYFFLEFPDRNVIICGVVIHLTENMVFRGNNDSIITHLTSPTTFRWVTVVCGMFPVITGNRIKARAHNACTCTCICTHQRSSCLQTWWKIWASQADT